LDSVNIRLELSDPDRRTFGKSAANFFTIRLFLFTACLIKGAVQVFRQYAIHDDPAHVDVRIAEAVGGANAFFDWQPLRNQNQNKSGKVMLHKARAHEFEFVLSAFQSRQDGIGLAGFFSFNGPIQGDEILPPFR